MTLRFLLPFVALFIGIASINAGSVTVKSMPPSVVKTVPCSGELEVNPSLSEIKVTFSKDMMTDKMWSWCMASKDSFPKIVGNVRYMKDKRTCILPVKLEPGKTYAIWINTSRFNNFKDASGNPAVPYLLVFKTKNK